MFGTVITREVIQTAGPPSADEVLIRHIKVSRATYLLTTAQIDRLREMGVSPSVLDAMQLSGLLSEYRYCDYGYPPHYHDGYGFGHFSDHEFYHGGNLKKI